MTTEAQTQQSNPQEELAQSFGYGIGEILYLLSRFDNESAQRSAEELMVGWPVTSEDMKAAGSSSLLVRGQLSVEGDALVPTSITAVATYALGNATAWTTMSFLGEDSTQGALFIHSPEAVLFLQPRGLGSWIAQVRGPGASVSDIWSVLAQEYVNAVPEGRIVLATRHGKEMSRNVAMRKQGPAWQLAAGRGDERAVELTGTVEPEALAATLWQQLGEA